MIERNIFFNNTFDACKILAHEDDPNYNVLYCRNIMNERDKHFLYKDKFAMCQNHYCAIIYDTTALTNKILTCSGAIFSFQNNEFFNPINIHSPVLADLVNFKGNTLDFISSNFKYYYIKDSRSSFIENIVDVNCTNDFSTCISFESGQSFCMGNVKDIRILNQVVSLIIGVAVALFFVTLVFLSLRQYVDYMKNIITVTVYTIPLIGMTLVFNSLFAISTMSYIIGNAFVMIMFPLVTSYVDTYFEKYIN